MSGVKFFRSLVTEFCNQIEDLGCAEGFNSRLRLITVAILTGATP